MNKTGTQISPIFTNLNTRGAATEVRPWMAQKLKSKRAQGRTKGQGNVHAWDGWMDGVFDDVGSTACRALDCFRLSG